MSPEHEWRSSVGSARERERSGQHERPVHEAPHGAIAYQDTHLICLATEYELGCGASSAEALKAGALNRHELFQGGAARLHVAASRPSRLPSDDDDDRTRRGNAISGDLTL